MSKLSDLQKHLIGLLFVLAAIAALPLFVTQRYFLGELVLFMIWASVAV